MDFARQQRDPTKHLIGIGFVVLVHALVIWALVSGLARTMVEVIKKPLTATIIEEIKAPPPPPPPPRKIVEPPKVQPMETYVPPPDVPVPTVVAPVITSVTPTPPPEPVVIAAPAVVVAPPAPPRPAQLRVTDRLGGDDIVYPRAAIRAGVEKGQVLARVLIDEKGNVYDVVIVRATPPRHFDRAVIEALSTWRFKAEGQKYTGEIEINFTLKD